MGVKRVGMLVSEKVDRKGKSKERGNEQSVELTPQPDVTTLSLFRCFIHLDVGVF